MTATKLQAREARAIHDVEVAIAKTKRELEELEARRKDLRARHGDKVPISDVPEEAAKGIRKIVAGGIKIRIAPQISGDYFALSEYIKAGHVVTAAMGEHIKPGREYDRWTVTGPPKTHDAVEPAR